MAQLLIKMAYLNQLLEAPGGSSNFRRLFFVGLFSGGISFQDAKSYLNFPFSACNFSFFVAQSLLGKDAKNCSPIMLIYVFP